MIIDQTINIHLRHQPSFVGCQDPLPGGSNLCDETSKLSWNLLKRGEREEQEFSLRVDMCESLGVRELRKPEVIHFH